MNNRSKSRSKSKPKNYKPIQIKAKPLNMKSSISSKTKVESNDLLSPKTIEYDKSEI